MFSKAAVLIYSRCAQLEVSSCATRFLRFQRSVHTSGLHLSRFGRASVSLASDSLWLTLPGSEPQNHVFPYVWLRDSDPQLIHPQTRQKLHSSADIPIDVKPVDVRVSEDGKEIILKWNDESLTDSSFPWPKSTSFSIDFLQRQADPNGVRTHHHDVTPAPWTRMALETSNGLYLEYDNVMKTDEGLLLAVSRLTSYGILFISGVPSKNTSDEAAELPKLAERFGRIRDTFYGRTWDVMSRGTDSRNVAYTDLNLGLHIDLLYFESPPRYQILHMLRNRGVTGGASIFSDGFRAAYRLKEVDREAFDTLCVEPIAFHYMNDGHHLYQEHPTIQLAPPGSHAYDGKDGEPVVQYVNYSPPFQAPLPLATAQNPKFLPALKKFSSLLAKDDGLFECRLGEGTAVIFENRRVLHGRREFVNTIKKPWNQVGEAEEGTRWLKGCYIEAEGILDRLNTLSDRQLRRGIDSA
jgi:gamma-butyrobetaine dioxygenase